MNTELLRKYITGDASQEEKEAIQLWLEADEKNREELISLRKLYNMMITNLPETSQTVIISRNGTRRIIAEFLKIAAAILITFSCTCLFLRPKSEDTAIADGAQMQILHVPAGQRAELTLADGTKVWLNSLTTFEFPDRFTETSREVFLDGEGYFDVMHDANKLFKVITREHTVKALGTEFNVMSYNKNERFETSLLDGSVEIMSNITRQTVSLMPGNRAYTENGQLVTSYIEHYDQFLWRNGIISFAHERVDAILQKLELYYDVGIANRNKSIAGLRYTGKFRTKDGVEHVLNVLQVPTGLRYRKDIENNFIQIY
jgi:ferric-dicitrate binding protein FerR (iron transport regulator)